MENFQVLKIAKQLLTGVDGENHDIGRWSWLCSSLAVVGAALLNWYHSVDIDLISLGTSLSAVAAAHGVAIKMKKDTEPL